MTSTKRTGYTPLWQEGTRVRLTRRGHPDFNETAAVISALPNPSELQERQWYDVRFENGRYGRFLARYLERVESLPEARPA